MKTKKTNLKESLSKKLTKKQLAMVPSSYDVVGDMLIFADFPKELKKKEKAIAESFLAQHKNIKTIAKKTKKYSGKYRLPKLKIIAGKRKKETLHKENNISLKLNVEKVYFSPRISNERLRISKLIKPNESILVMFSGCGVYPLVISKNTKTKEIYGIEINPIAHRYAVENQFLNKLKNIKLFKGDVKNILPKINKKFDRILMPLPKGAESYLKLALSKIKKKGVIHFYDFLKENEFALAMEKIKSICKKKNLKYKILDIVKCGQFSPYVFRVCIDFKIL